MYSVIAKHIIDFQLVGEYSLFGQSSAGKLKLLFK